ncbi:RidA family protein [Kribbella sp. NPDC003505]|uniref:RidA family protein n=1 Tax=Kribbella sp. NPDC003505 TaxID=3154448 RepID=UPI0033B65BE1
MNALTRHLSAPAGPDPVDGSRPAIAPCTRIGDIVLTSGQTAHLDGANVANGQVPVDVDLLTARSAAWQCARNAIAALATAIELDDVVEVVRMTVFIASHKDFTEQHIVADAATAYLQYVFGTEIGIHTRSAIGVAALPTGSTVEVEVAVRVRPGS